MPISNRIRGALRRIAGASPETAIAKRRTLALPSILNTYGPRADSFPKPTPINLRRFSETPVARKAINTIKDRIAGMRWRVQPRPGRTPADGWRTNRGLRNVLRHQVVSPISRLGFHGQSHSHRGQTIPWSEACRHR